MIKKLLHEHGETLMNLFWRCLQIFGKQGVVFLIFILCAKNLSTYDFGIYNYALAIILFLIMFGDFGISTSASRYVAQYSVSDPVKLRRVAWSTTLMIGVLATLIACIVLIFGPSYLGSQFKYVLYLLPMIILAPLTSLFDGIYRGRKKFKLLAIISTVIGLLSVVFVYLLIKNHGLTGALIAQDIFYLILLVVLIAFDRDFDFKLDRVVMSEIGKYSLLYGLAVIGNYLFIKFGVLILGKYGYLEELSTYELINRILMLLVLPFTLIGQVVAPNFAMFASKKEYQKIYKKSLKYTIVFTVLALFLGLLLSVLLPIVFKIYFSEYYKMSYFHLTFVFGLLAFVVNVWSATFDAGILIPTGYANLMARVYLVGGVIGTVASLYFVRSIGYIGVIATFAISNLVFVVLLRYFYLRKLFILQRIKLNENYSMSSDSLPG